MFSGYFFYNFLIGLGFGIFSYFIYASIAMHRTVNTSKHGSWRKESIETTLSSDEFIQRIQNICLIRKWFLIEISDRHATIRTYPDLLGYGIFFYIELIEGEKNTINVFARGAIRQFVFYRSSLYNLINLLYKA